MKLLDKKYGKPIEKKEEKRIQLREFANDALTEAGRYNSFKRAVLRYFGANSPEELDDKRRKRFYRYVDSEWKRYKRRAAGVRESIQEGGQTPQVQIQSLEDFVDSSTMKEADGDMLGADVQDLPPDELRKYLARTQSGEKEKTDKYKMPYVHRGNIPIVSDETGQQFDLEALKADIMKRPPMILKQNEKIQHSGGGATAYYNIGLPALRGLAVNEKTGQFVVVNTCPGAGACKVYCYAKKGGYIQWKASSMSQTRMLNFLLNDPDGFKNKLISELKTLENKFKGKNVKLVVRWHDAGDFFSDPYLKMAYSVAEALPNVDFYAYTKMADVASGEKPKNFLINFSMGALPSQEKQVDFTKTKHSKVVPKELFADLIQTDGKIIKKDANGKYLFVQNGMEILKDRMAKQYNIPRDSIITYDEMTKIPVGTEPKYNVIVFPGDGDDSANRKDVLGTYLMIH